MANGLVHLIDRPLVVIATPMWDYIQAEKNRNQLGKFASALSRLGGDLETMIRWDILYTDSVNTASGGKKTKNSTKRLF